MEAGDGGRLFFPTHFIALEGRRSQDYNPRIAQNYMLCNPRIAQNYMLGNPRIAQNYMLCNPRITQNYLLCDFPTMAKKNTILGLRKLYAAQS